MRWFNYFAVLSSVLSSGLALGISMPLMSLRLERLGYGDTWIGIMSSMPAVGAMIGATLAHKLARNSSAPFLVRASLLVGAVAIALIPIFQTYTVWLFLRALIGIALTVIFIVGKSWVQQIVVEHMKGKLMALYGSGFALSQLAGPSVLGVLGADSDYGFAAAASIMVATVFLIPFKAEVVIGSDSKVSFQSLRIFCARVPSVAWALILFAAFESLILTLLPIYCVRQGYSTSEALYMVSAVVFGHAALQVPIGFLVDRFALKPVFMTCALSLMGVSFAIPLLIGSAWVWPAWILYGACGGGLFTLSLVAIGQHFSKAEILTANAHMAQVWSLGCLCGPLLSSFAVHWFGPDALLWIICLGAIYLLYLLRLTPNSKSCNDCA